MQKRVTEYFTKLSDGSIRTFTELQAARNYATENGLRVGVRSAITELPEGVKKVACPHCNKVGDVTHKAVRVKKGISGSKATAGLFTGGLSLWVTGLSRKEDATEAYCKNCGTRWTIY